MNFKTFNAFLGDAEMSNLCQVLVAGQWLTILDWYNYDDNFIYCRCLQGKVFKTSFSNNQPTKTLIRLSSIEAVVSDAP